MNRLLPLLTLSACAPGPGGITLEELRSGDYAFSTHAVVDGCLDGALEALFMPEGPESVREWDYPVYIPSLDELPLQYAVDFRAPFMGMEVTVDAVGEATLAAVGEPMVGVALGGSTGDCVVDMRADATLEAVARTRVTGEATIEITDPRGDDGLCPVFDTLPCGVALTIEGTLP